MPHYRIRNNMLYIHYSERYKTYRLSTGIKVPTGASVTKDGNMLAGRDTATMVLNGKLIGLMSDVKMILMGDGGIEERIRLVKRRLANDTHEVNDKTVLLSDYATRFVYSVEEGDVVSRSGKRLSPSILNVYRSVCGIIQDMKAQGSDLDLTAVDLSGKPLDKRQEAASTTRRYYRRFHDYMIENEYRMTTQTTYLSVLLRFIRYAENEYLFQIDKTFPKQTELVPIVALTPDIVKDFMALNPADISDPYQRFAYEASYVILITSLRLIDALNLNIHNIAMVDGQPMLFSYINQKTGERTNTPIPMRLYSILRTNWDTFGSVYCMRPNYSLAKKILGDAMPKLFAMLPSTQAQITVSRLKPDGQTYETISKPLYQYVRPHMLRKSAITAMLHSGVSERIVKYSSGHTGNSKSFSRYVAYVEQVYNKEISEYQKSIGG